MPRDLRAKHKKYQVTEGLPVTETVTSVSMESSPFDAWHLNTSFAGMLFDPRECLMTKEPLDKTWTSSDLEPSTAKREG